MEKYIPKVGDWVRLIKQRTKWNAEGYMDHYDGRVVQITDVYDCNRIRFNGDDENVWRCNYHVKDRGYWVFDYSDGSFEPCDPPTVNHFKFS